MEELNIVKNHYLGLITKKHPTYKNYNGKCKDYKEIGGKE